MNLPDEVRQRLAAELRLVADRMAAEPDTHTRLYFFSAGYGEASRALNVSWDAELALLHLVLQAAYATVNSRLQAMAEGRDRPVTLAQGLLERLAETTRQLADVVKDCRDHDLPRLLARIAELTYAVTGNGYYLYLKGVIKI